MGLQCIASGCVGQIDGRHDLRFGERWHEGDEHDCPECGAKYVIAVTDDYEDDAIAFLVPRAAEKGER